MKNEMSGERERRGAHNVLVGKPEGKILP